MNINQMYPGSYLKATDFPNPGQLQIASIAMETVGQGQQAEQKPVMYFSGLDRGLVLNKTNANILVDSYGEETQAWMGQWVEIRSERVQFGDKMVSGIRLRALPQAAPAQTAPVQPQPPQGAPMQSGMPQPPQGGYAPPQPPQGGFPPFAGQQQPPQTPQGNPVPGGVAPTKMPWEE